VCPGPPVAHLTLSLAFTALGMREFILLGEGQLKVSAGANNAQGKHLSSRVNCTP